MMLISLLLFATPVQAAPAQDVPPLGNEEIVVIAERLRSISANVGRDREGRFHCSLSGTTGSPRLDDRLCRAATDCVRRVGGEDAAVRSCLESRKPRLLRQLRREMERER